MTTVWVEANGYGTDKGTLCLVQRFDQDEAYVAMKYPYTPSYNEAYLTALEKVAHAHVVRIGESAKGRALRAVEIGDGTLAERKLKPCLIMYAREHANEHDTSWVAQGAIEFLTGGSPEAKGIRDSCVVLVIPLLDPDGANSETYENIIETFTPDQETPESRAYGKYFKDWVAAGNRLDVVLNIHNIESGEGSHLFCFVLPLKNSPVFEASKALHDSIISDAAKLGFHSPYRMPASGGLSRRLGGWLSSTYGPVHLPMEVNSQESMRHLTLAELHELGATMVSSTAKFFSTQSGTHFLEETISTRRQYADRWAHFAGEITTEDPFIAERSCRVLSEKAKGSDGELLH